MRGDATWASRGEGRMGRHLNLGLVYYYQPERGRGKHEGEVDETNQNDF